MPSLNHAFVSPVADDADANTVSPSNWNANIQTTVPSTDLLDQFTRMVLPGTERLTAAGTGRARITEFNVNFVGTYAVGSPNIVDGNYLLQYREARLQGNARATVAGTGELFIFDLAPVGRLVLGGRGG